jgi:hypothetical protein
MANGEEGNAFDGLLEAITEIEQFSKKEKITEGGETTEVELTGNEDIVDIMTFCNDPQYLDLPGNNFHLWVSQRTILKTFYMGTRGNENLKLDQDEWQWLYDNSEDDEIDGVVYKKNLDEVIQKLLDKEKSTPENPIPNFRELHLVLGRRGSKTIMASIISAYEVYKLLVIGGGDPHKYYGLPYDDEIAVINVALSQEQAGRLFGQVSSRLRNSPFFKGRIAKETTKEIRLYTDSDLKKKSAGAILSVPGSILILCGHSNPDSLCGYNTILILFDELAFYDETGKVTGRYFYNRLKPSLTHFLQYGDGRLVEISSPNSMNGIFFDIFQFAKEYNDIISYQLPTWITNPGVTYDHPDLKRDRESNIEMFSIEYGAQWSKSGLYGNYFDAALIDRCVAAGIAKGIGPHTKPQRGFNYYLHLDPAKNGNRYVAVLIAKERYVNQFGKKRTRLHLANIWMWRPVDGVGIEFHKADKDVLNICSIFRPIAVTYDQYSSNHSRELLRSHGINCIQTSYNRGFKQTIYQNLTELMIVDPEPELLLYDDGGYSNELIMEMKALKKKKTMRGISLTPDKDGDIKTDDLVDALAGACAMGGEAVRAALPEPVTVRMGYW